MIHATTSSHAKHAVLLLMLVLQRNSLLLFGTAFAPTPQSRLPSRQFAGTKQQQQQQQRHYQHQRQRQRQELRYPPLTTTARGEASAVNGDSGSDSDNVNDDQKRKKRMFASILNSYQSHDIDSQRNSSNGNGNLLRGKIGKIAKRPDIESGRRYRSKDWLINILSLPNSFVLRRIKFHLLSNTFLSLIVVLINRYVCKVGIPILAHTMVGGFLGLLLVFRTDSAYSRFWEARGIWRQAKENCRNLAVCTSTQLKHYSPKAATRLLELLIAFPEALAYTCLSGSMPLTNRLKRIVPERMHNDPAMCLCLMMQNQILEAELESPDSALRITEARYQLEASSFIQALVDATTHSEIIVRTPVPWSYSRHTSRFLTIWCGTLPFALVPTFGWLTLPAIMVICWCLFGIEEIGHLIEQPFVSDDIVSSQGFLSKADRADLKNKAYDLGIPVEQLAWMISGQVVELAHCASQFREKRIVTAPKMELQNPTDDPTPAHAGSVDAGDVYKPSVV